MEKKEMQKKNFDLKQLIPIYGVYQAIKDYSDKKPSMLDLKDHPARFYGSAFYHGLGLSAFIEGSLELLIK
ncbi:MAG: hypothetical protein Q8O84_02480 [Nanoarchaeota archaeon]|nr:hypothetical protein [Nanoarchaeota archaeon]